MMAGQFYMDYLYVAVFIFLGIGFAAMLLYLSSLVRPSKPGHLKSISYECGMLPIGEPWTQFTVRYYIFALLFMVFDVETVFLYPWALVFKRLGWFGFWEMIIFIVILVVGLAYAWSKRVLRWV